ncbi:MAG: TolC family protein [Acidobacteria bacterium]|nr:TolC family protein [Acidobacteriota bacterium]MBW4043493.1 TolC family protein [Acidobacteriota bacterium]
MRRTCSNLLSFAVAVSIGATATLAHAQSNPAGRLPDAPVAAFLQTGGAATGPTGMQQPGTAPSAPGENGKLTRREAEQMALEHNPRVSVSKLLAMAQHQVYRETRSAELPQLNGSATALDAQEASRISSGALTASRLLVHAGAGVEFSQLLFDFGRTRNLVGSSKLQERAQNANALATQEDIVLAADQAFYNALQAQALLEVANQTVNQRTATDTQVGEMTKNNLKSTLDQSFADVDLSQAKLLQLDAQNNVAATMAALDDVLGLDHEVQYQLVDDAGDLPSLPPDPKALVQLAIQQRPDLQSLNYNQQSAMKFSRAQHDQMLPTISALGTVGITPVRPDNYYNDNWWGGIGVNLNVPIFDGFLYVSQAKEAALRAQSASEQTRNLRNMIVRDVNTSWIAAKNAYQKVSVTAQLLKEANMAFGLAKTRYQLGLSNIVELTQAQLQQTSAQISNTNAQYQYRLSLATLNYEIGATP